MIKTKKTCSLLRFLVESPRTYKYKHVKDKRIINTRDKDDNWVVVSNDIIVDAQHDIDHIENSLVGGRFDRNAD